jgi:hypothetical protein
MSVWANNADFDLELAPDGSLLPANDATTQSTVRGEVNQNNDVQQSFTQRFTFDGKTYNQTPIHLDLRRRKGHFRRPIFSESSLRNAVLQGSTLSSQPAISTSVLPKNGGQGIKIYKNSTEIDLSDNEMEVELEDVPEAFAKPLTKPLNNGVLTLSMVTVFVAKNLPVDVTKEVKHLDITYVI